MLPTLSPARLPRTQAVIVARPVTHTIPVEPLTVGDPSQDPSLLPPTATYAGSHPFYLTDAGAQADVSRWATFRAVQDVDVSGNSLLLVKELTDVTGAFGTAGQLLSSTGSQVEWVTVPTSEQWATFPAVQDVDVSGNSLLLVKELTDVSGQFGTAGQLLSSNGTQVAWVPAPTPEQWATFPAVQDVDVSGNSLLLVKELTDVAGAFGTAGQVLSSTGTQITWTDLSAGVTTLNTQSGDIAITSANAGLTVGSTGPGNILLTLTPQAETVRSLNQQVGVIDISSANANLTVDASVPGTILLTVPDQAETVTSLNTQVGDIAITSGSPDLIVGSIGPGNILLTLSLEEPVTTLNTQVGDIVITSANANLTVGSTGPGNILLTVPSPAEGVASVNGATGAITVAGASGVDAATVGQTVTLSAPGIATAQAAADAAQGTADTALADAAAAEATATAAGAAAATADATAVAAGVAAAAAQATASTALAQSGVTSVNSGTGAITVAAGAGISVGTVGSTITVSTAGGGGVDINGLLNKINAFPALPYTTASSSTPATNQVPTAIVPDGTFPVNVPTVGAVQGGWGFSKANGSAAFFNYYQYNPRFGAPAAPLPYIKSRVQSAWALIRPTVNLYLAGLLAINLYSFDDANPPTSSFFNTRWAYSNSTGTVAGASGTNLYAGYTYLLYANDSPRITNTSAIGVPDSQISGLRDPYDIYTDVNHIALQNCVVAFNPWTDGTNYRTWTATGVFILNDTVIFAGFGTNYNGLFFIATGPAAVGVAPMVNGVVSANWALISPQPSSFADQPVSGITLTQATATGQAVGYVVLDIGFSYGPTTTSTTVSEHISLLPN